MKRALLSLVALLVVALAVIGAQGQDKSMEKMSAVPKSPEWQKLSTLVGNHAHEGCGHHVRGRRSPRGGMDVHGVGCAGSVQVHAEEAGQPPPPRDLPARVSRRSSARIAIRMSQ